MTKEDLKTRIDRRKYWMGDEETQIARNKLFMGQALTQKERQLLLKYLRKLEKSLDKIIEECMIES